MTKEKLFSPTEGELIPAMRDAYTCAPVGGEVAKPRQLEASDSAVVARTILHMTTFNDGTFLVSPITKSSESGSMARYVVRRAGDDPTLASVYAFHRLYGDVYAYTAPSEYGGYVVFFLRVRGTTLERLEMNREDEAALAVPFANKRGVTLSKVEDALAYKMSGEPVDQIEFLKDLAEHQMFVRTSSCVAVAPAKD